MIRNKSFLDGSLHRLVKEFFHNPAGIKSPLPVLGKRRVVPNLRIQIQSHKPPERHVARQPSHQSPLGGHSQEITSQEGQKQLLRRNRGTAFVRIQGSAQLPDMIRVNQAPDLPERIILRHKLFQVDAVEHRGLGIVCSHHVFFLLMAPTYSMKSGGQEGFVNKLLGELVLPTAMRDPRENPTDEFSYVDIASVDNETKAIVTTKRIVGAQAPSR